MNINGQDQTAQQLLSTALGPCEHMKIRRVPTPPGSIHHEEIRCVDCNKFMGFGAKPANIERQKRNHEKIIRLEPLNMTEWERNFLVSIKKLDKLSPKQQERLDELYAKRS